MNKKIPNRISNKNLNQINGGSPCFDFLKKKIKKDKNDLKIYWSYIKKYFYKEEKRSSFCIPIKIWEEEDFKVEEITNLS